jgi:hypothetical protein
MFTDQALCSAVNVSNEWDVEKKEFFDWVDVSWLDAEISIPIWKRNKIYIT